MHQRKIAFTVYVPGSIGLIVKLPSNPVDVPPFCTPFFIITTLAKSTGTSVSLVITPFSVQF